MKPETDRRHLENLPAWSGAALTLFAIVALEFLAAAGFRVPNPPAIVVLAVVFAAFTGGLSWGMLSASLAWIYFSWSFSIPEAPFRYTAENFWRVLIWAAATPAMVLLVGSLKRSADRAAASAVRAATAEAGARAGQAAFEALRTSERRYMTVAEMLSEGVMILREGRFAYANRTVERLLGVPRAELVGTQFAPYIHPEFREAVQDRHRRRSAGETLPARYEIRIVPRDGEPVWVQVANERVDWGDGPAILTLISDIRERKAADEAARNVNADLERRVEERTAELRDSVRELDAFCYTISHDLRAPLRALNGHAHMVCEDAGAELPAESRRHLEQIARNAQHMGDLIDDLLDFARVVRKELGREVVPMEALAREVLAELLPRDGATRHEIVVGPLADCRGDPGLVRQVWRNLLSNALKYSRGRDPVAIEIGQDPQDGAYFVRDNGVGFEMQYAEKLFEVFSRLHPSAEFEGTGVGLAIVERIVRRHGGRVAAHSEVGQGATFRFTLG